MASEIYCVTIQLLSTLIVTVSGGNLSTEETCPCSFNMVSHEANCFHGGLRKIPNCIPRTIKRLILNSNNITNQPGQFNGFTVLKFLDLSYNFYFAADKDSFSGLISLNTLFLNVTNNGQMKTDLFSGLPRLDTLSLSFIHLRYIDAETFVHLHSLTYLDLSGNFLTDVKNNLFLKLPHLQHLDLGHNEHPKFHARSFAGLSQLKFLSLKENLVINAYYFPSNLFQPLIQLEELHLEGICSLREFHYNCSTIHDHLSRLPSLKKLHLDNFVINSLGQGFHVLKKLEELYFLDLVMTNECKVFLSNKTFDNLKTSSLSKLYIEKCNINNIKPYTFSYFPSLTSLELISVELAMLPRICSSYTHIETGLQNTNISHLRLQLKCQYGPISISRLKGLKDTELEYLEISDGRVRALLDGFFHSLPVSLKYLYLQNNYICAIYSFYDLFRLKNLKILDLSNSKDTLMQFQNSSPSSTTKEAFSSVQSACVSRTTGTVSRAYVYKDIPGAYNRSRRNQYHQQNSEFQFPESRSLSTCWKQPPSLDKIDISHSELLCDINNVLCNSDNSLKVLNVAHQRKRVCFDYMWEEMKNLLKLEQLDLTSNRIKYIPAKVFSQMKYLKSLLLHHNSLSAVDFDLETLVLETLDLSDNSIQFISSKLTRHLDKIADNSKLVIYLAGNSLVCDCERIEFVAWLRYSKTIFQKEKLTCKYNTNENYSISAIAELHDKLKMNCIAPDVLKCCITGFVVLHLALGIVTLLWYKRWKIRYLLAIGRKSVHPYHPIEEREIELEYDVYISYERDHEVTCDETLHKFVTQKLYPELQRQGFKVLIREELEPGVGLYNALSQSLQRCRKVVSLISKDYCRDYWNVFEFNIAVLEGIYTKRQVLIPVAFESLGREDLHAEVHAYLSSEPVSYYSRNVREVDLFYFLCEKIRDNREFD